MSRILFTSDTHYFHANCFHFFNPGRQVFGSHVKDMNLGLVKNWKSVVSDDDTVYILGDFCFGPPRLITETLRQLNGNIILVTGNHDKSPKRMMELGFKEAHKELRVVITDEAGNPHNVFLKHKPPKDDSWKKDTGCDWYLHGHVHTLFSRRDRLINVGVDVCNYTPMTFQQLLDRPYLEDNAVDPYEFEYS